MRAVISFNLHGRLERVSLPAVYTVGRAPACDLAIDHAFVSALHCTFFLEHHGVAVVDHESSNGTSVNGAQVRGKAILSAGDVIEVGPVVFTLGFVDDEPMGAEAPTAPRPAMMLGLAMKTQTEMPAKVRTVIEVVDGPRRGEGRLAFRDAVATRAGTVVVVGDLAPCADDGEVLGLLRRELRALANTGAKPDAIVLGLSSLLGARERTAQLIVARIEPISARVIYVNAHQGGPCIVQSNGTLLRLDGDPATEHEAHLDPGSVLVLPSTALVNVLRMMWDLERPFLPKERRASAVAIWLTNHSVRNQEGGSAVCVEIAAG